MSGVMKAIGSIFSPKTVAPPAAAVTRMPDPQDPQLAIAARKKVEDRRKNGRAGTIYTSGSSYSGQNLGGTA